MNSEVSEARHVTRRRKSRERNARNRSTRREPKVGNPSKCQTRNRNALPESRVTPAPPCTSVSGHPTSTQESAKTLSESARQPIPAATVLGTNPPETASLQTTVEIGQSSDRVSSLNTSTSAPSAKWQTTSRHEFAKLPDCKSATLIFAPVPRRPFGHMQETQGAETRPGRSGWCTGVVHGCTALSSRRQQRPQRRQKHGPPNSATHMLRAPACSSAAAALAAAQVVGLYAGLFGTSAHSLAPTQNFVAVRYFRPRLFFTALLRCIFGLLLVPQPRH